MQLYKYIGCKFAKFDVYNRMSGIKAGRISPVLIPFGWLQNSYWLAKKNLVSLLISNGTLIKTTYKYG